MEGLDTAETSGGEEWARTWVVEARDEQTRRV
jgi:hypothetical protein